MFLVRSLAVRLTVLFLHTANSIVILEQINDDDDDDDDDEDNIVNAVLDGLNTDLLES